MYRQFDDYLQIQSLRECFQCWGRVSIIIVMYKPSLKRGQLPRETKMQSETASNFKKITERAVRTDANSLMISSKLLETPNSQRNDRKCILAPLYAQSHPYPPQVADFVENAPVEKRSTIGAYQEINWISIGNRIEFWVTGDTASTPKQFQGEISCVSVGELKASTLPLKIRSHYILAVGIKNEVTLYCLETFTLRIWETGIKYTLTFSWQVQQIQFIDNFKVLFFSNPNYIQIVEFGDSNRILQTAISLYRRYLPTVFSQPARIVENIIYSKNRIYVLYTEVREKLWLVNTLHKLFDEEAYETYVKTKNIEIFAVGDSSIQQLYKISEEDIKRRMSNYIFGWKADDFKIQNIFIDRESQKEEELGIITDNGIYITLRDMSKVYFSKDPTFLENTITYQSAYLLSPTSAYRVKSDRESQRCDVINSLGMNNLTLTNESLVWAGADRVDGVHCQNLIAEMLLRRTNQKECYLFSNNEWAVFTRNAFYTIRQLPIRHFLIAIIFVNITQLDDYEPLSCQNTSYKMMMERIELSLTAQGLLKHLIEIIISGEKFITVNNIVLELVSKELKGEVAQNYRDWAHELKPTLTKKEIQVTDEILSKVWNLIFSLQYKEIPSNVANSKHICDLSVYWQAVHSIYYQLVSPLFKIYPQQFKANKDLIENIFSSLKSLQGFFELKFKHEYYIREQSLSKISKSTFGQELNSTEASIERDVDISWVEESVSLTISGKIMSESIIQVQEKLKEAVTLTINLMTIYFGLSNYEIKFPSFGEILRNRVDQQTLARVIISNSDFTSLVEIDSKIPQLQLKKDIQFMSWANKMELEGDSNNHIDLEELAELISSTYFEESLKLLNNRYDLQMKMLELYEEVILAKREALIQSNTLKQRNYLGNTLFPEDEEAFLTYKREYYNSQLDKIITEEKRCLKEAAQMSMQEGRLNVKCSKLMDGLIMIAANKPSLYDYLENELKLSGNLQKYTKLRTLKYKEYHKYAYNKKINYKPKPLERELFPHP